MMLADVAGIGSAGDWGEHGLAGLVIFALMTLVIGVVVAAMRTITTQFADHKQERKDWTAFMEKKDQAHAGERDQWAARIDKRDEKLDEAFNKLTDAIRERSI